MIRYKGFNFAGGEFGGGSLPGSLGSDYIYPRKSGDKYPDIDNMFALGANRIRFCLKMERIMRQLDGNFHGPDIEAVDAVVDYVTNVKGGFVMIDPHNYCKYYGVRLATNGSFTIPDLVTFWKAVANRYKNNPRVQFDLMNEPFGLPATFVAEAMQACVNGIRDVGAGNLILWPGTSWTGAHSWHDSGNAAALVGATDPANNFDFTVHQYLDSDSSGKSPTVHNNNVDILISRLARFEDWCEEFGFTASLDEVGIANNTVAKETGRRGLAHMETKSHVWHGYSGWSDGHWWGGYIFSLNGVNNPVAQEVYKPNFALGVGEPADPPGDNEGHEPGGEPPAPPPVPNLGTEAFISAGATSGHTGPGDTIWVKDHSYVGGNVVDRGEVGIAGTDNPRLYQTERWGLTSYKVPMENGTYTVKLHFAETYLDAAGARVFDVDVMGQVLADLDIFAEVGKNAALVKTFDLVTVVNGVLDIKFTAKTQSPLINGIQIEPFVETPPEEEPEEPEDPGEVPSIIHSEEIVISMPSVPIRVDVFSDNTVKVTKI